MKYFAQQLAAHRRIAALAVIIVTLIALAGLPRLRFEAWPPSTYQSARDEDSGATAGLPGSAKTHDPALPDKQAVAPLHHDRIDAGLDCVVLVSSDKLFSSQSIRGLRRIVSAIRRLDGVADVRSLDDVVDFSAGLPQKLLPIDPDEVPMDIGADDVRDAAMAHAMVPGNLLSADPDGHWDTTLIIITLDASLDGDEPRKAFIEQLRSTVADAAAPFDLKIHITGETVVTVGILSNLQRDSLKFSIIGPVISTIMGLFLFRRPSAVLVTALPPALGVIWTLGALAWVGEPITVLTTVIPTLVLVIGYSDTVHLMMHVRRRLGEGDSPSDAAVSSVEHVGMACFLTSLTTAIGFGSLALTSVPVISRFGLACAAGTLLTFIAVIASMPLLVMTSLGKRCGAETSAAHQRIRAILRRMSHTLLAHARPVAIAGILITLAMLLSVFRLSVDITPIESFIPDGRTVDSYRAYGRAFGGELTIDATVRWGAAEKPPADLLPALRDIEKFFEDDPYTSYPLSLLSVLRSIRLGEVAEAPDDSMLSIVPDDLLRSVYRPDRGLAVVRARVPDTGATIGLPAQERLEAALRDIDARYDGVTITLGGSQFRALRSIHRMVSDLARSLGAAAGLILIVMTLAFRSIRFGLIGVIPNVFPLAGAAAYLVWSGQSLQFTSVIVFTVCLGIAVDDTIHFLSHLRERIRSERDAASAAEETIVHVGEVLVTTTLIFIVGFAALAVSNVPMLRLYGGLACLAIAAALVADVLILPALWVCFSRKRA